MIESLTFTPEQARAVVPYWDSCSAWKGRTEFKFNPGLTVVMGPNGCGKSALFAFLARLLAAEQGGRSVVTYDHLRDRAKGKYDEIALIHDGTGVRHLSLDTDVGLIGGMAGFDDDFMVEGVDAIYRKKLSSGQNTTSRLVAYLQDMKDGRASGVTYKAKKDQAPEGTVKFLAGTGVPGKPTFLLDEPDRTLDTRAQFTFWTRIARMVAAKCQVIIISHNPLVPLLIQDTNIWYLTEGYQRDIARDIVDYILPPEDAKG